MIQSARANAFLHAVGDDRLVNDMPLFVVWS